MNRFLFIFSLITTVVTIIVPVHPFWVGWILSGVSGFMTGKFLVTLLTEKI